VKVTSVVLSWNGREDTLACLRSLALVEYEPFDVVVVDNGSSDGSADAVASEHPPVRLVGLERNLGFTGGMNAGIRIALEGDAEAVLLLNNDMTVAPGFVQPLVDALVRHEGVAAACSQVLFAGEPPRVWYAGARYDPRRGYQGRQLGYGGRPLPATRAPFETERACAGAMLVPRGVLEAVGVFDETLFAYAEDTDWSLRARAAGLRVLVVPASLVRHAVSSSTGGEGSPTAIYYTLRNSLVVAERHAPLRASATWRRRLVLVAAHLSQAVLSRRKAAALAAVGQAWRDFHRGRLGERTTT
jgi:GT2 family glycosyltransferase